MTQNTSLYKYLSEEYAIGMLERGNIRIGTLYEYRTHWNDQVKDEDEAKFSANQHFGVYTKENEKEVSPLLRGNISIGRGTVIGLNLSNNFSLPDRNIYCMTKIASEAVMKEFDCNACIEIANPDGFADAILDYLRQEGLSSGVGDRMSCTYDGRALDHSQAVRTTYRSGPDPNNPAQIITDSRSVYAGYFAKTPIYEPQKEMRLLVEPAAIQQRIEPLVRDIPGIIPFIKRLTF